MACRFAPTTCAPGFLLDTEGRAPHLRRPIVASITLSGMPTARIGWRGTRATWIPVFVVGISLILASPTDAQRAKDNAVTAASDAFGTVVGNQTVGLYSPTNARGFSPTQAENVRIEGLYFDQQASSIDPYLFSGSDMRV
ncbi:MAG: tonB dependent receptor family protein, partial [Gammaproteobacteria bacterium]|nr:tonB dependent receptor family protein [Gammaproteobacteria bacterium]